MRKINIVFFLLLLSACSQSDLERSIFLPDPEHPELPGYSEWGYNTFGAFFDQQPFISNNAERPIEVVEEDGNVSFRFTGQRGVSRYASDEAFSIQFVLTGPHVERYDDLVALHNSSWDLASEATEVIVGEGSSRDTLEVLSGMLSFRRAQYLLVDQEPEQVILSGVFEFRAVNDGVSVTVSNGRFDVGIADHNFFTY